MHPWINLEKKELRYQRFCKFIKKSFKYKRSIDEQSYPDKCSNSFAKKIKILADFITQVNFK